jgi:sulfhydrogenase subunit beta (sulfur reductase)
MKLSLSIDDRIIIERSDLQRLLDALTMEGYQVVGPRVRDGAIVYDSLESIEDLPIGWTDEQDGGTYRLTRRDDDALFGYVVGPHSWKRYLHLPEVRLWRAQCSGREFEIEEENEEVPRYAFIGVRACELSAIAIQDEVLLHGEYKDPWYQARRQQCLVVAVNCGVAGGTCFCRSMDTGPKVTFGFDLALTEILEGGRHYFVCEVGTERGGEVLRNVPYTEANEEQRETAERITKKVAGQMGRSLDTAGLKELLSTHFEHKQWDVIADRCLTCGNCTMVCPTCFCTTVEDVTDLRGEHTERVRKWDSCFTLDFSYIHGGSVRVSPRSRYRQWVLHKLSAWVDQFGTFGCVGCGRCITWCPVAIDITEVVKEVQNSVGHTKEESHGDA